MKRVLILMTALLPTTGHADLIKFALNLPSLPQVTVLIHARSFEPTSGYWRKGALLADAEIQSAYNEDYLNIGVRENDYAPQNPEDHPHFWDWWRDEIADATGGTQFDYVVASEPYGAPLADAIGAQFLPYDIKRVLNPARGTLIRSDLMNNWEWLLPGSRALLHRTYTLFGQESVGKTTISKAVASRLGTWVPEYARPYLEAVGPELSKQKMENIWAGQYSLQMNDPLDEPVTIQDTDLFSTVGYWMIGDYGDVPAELLMDAKYLSSHRYYILPDDVPFEEDPLRYGGEVRESTTKFWLDLLNTHLNSDTKRIVMVPTGTLDDKVSFLVEDILKHLGAEWKPIIEFQRD